MTRVKISIGILCGLLFMSIMSEIWLTHRTEELTALTYSAEGAGELAEKWEKFRDVGSLFILNSKLIEIDRLCARVSTIPDGEELQGDLAEIRRMLERL